MAASLAHAVALKGYARIAFPGGRSALDLMRGLCICDLPWDNISITLIDERDVPPTNEASNELLIRSVMLTSKATNAPFESLRVSATAAGSVMQLNQSRNNLDIAVLGIGEDGHFASLFPANEAVPGLDDSTLGFIYTLPIGNPKVPRISMTLREILSADLVLLLLSSNTKEVKLNEGIENPKNPNNPVSYIISDGHPIYIEWPCGFLSKLMQGVTRWE